MPGDDNSGVFVGGWPDPGNDPFVAVNQGYEVQIDATDDADSTTGAIYNFQAPNAAARDAGAATRRAVEHVRDHRRRAEGLRAPERLAGQRVHLDRPGARPDHGRVGLQNHGTGDEVYFRDVQVKTGGGTDPGTPTVEGFADPTTGNAPLAVQFSATGADPDGGALSYKWVFGDGASALGSAPSHTYTTPGTYQAKVTVTDPDGKTATATVPVTVNAAGNAPPTVDVAADPVSGAAPLEVQFEAQAVDPDGPQNGLSYQWDFGDGGAQFGRTPLHTYLEPGTFTAKVTAKDAGGATATAQIEITVANPPGNAAPSVEALADPRSGAAPLRVRFSSAATDPDGDQLLSVWDFGDGVKAGGAAATHTYTQPGTYNATVTVTDPGGKSATATVAVTVAPAAAQAAPPAGVGNGDVAGESESRPLVRLAKTHKLARVVRRGLRYSVACESACRVASVLRVAGKRFGASSTRRIAAGRSRVIVLRLDRSARRRLAGRQRVRATLVTRVRTADGTRTLRTPVVLRR